MRAFKTLLSLAVLSSWVFGIHIASAHPTLTGALPITSWDMYSPESYLGYHFHSPERVSPERNPTYTVNWSYPQQTYGQVIMFAYSLDGGAYQDFGGGCINANPNPGYSCTTPRLSPGKETFTLNNLGFGDHTVDVRVVVAPNCPVGYPCGSTIKTWNAPQVKLWKPNSVVVDSSTPQKFGTVTVTSNIPEASWSMNGPDVLSGVKNFLSTFGLFMRKTDDTVIMGAGISVSAPVSDIDFVGYFSDLYSKKSDGAVYAQGRNDNGQAGIGIFSSYSPMEFVPLQQVHGENNIGFLSNPTKLGGDMSTRFAIMPGGKLLAWGWNASGKLGRGYIPPFAVNDLRDAYPMQVSGMSSGIIQAAVSPRSMYALKSDGTVWGWGDKNSQGELGAGNMLTSDISTPRQITGLPFIESIWMSEQAPNSAFAIEKTTGRVWGWGRNDLGQLGQGSKSVEEGMGRTGIFPPVQVGNLTGVKKVAPSYSATYALKNDGTVWAWGLNDHGQLGIGVQDYRYMVFKPVQVHGEGDMDYLTDVRDISTDGSSTYVVRSDGTIWGWGSIPSNYLGEKLTSSQVMIDKFTPVRIPIYGKIISTGSGLSQSYTNRPVGIYGVALNNNVPDWAPVNSSGSFFYTDGAIEGVFNMPYKCVGASCPGAIVCGLAKGKTFSAKPSANLCSDTSNPVVSQAGSTYSWTCGTNSCTATYNAGAGCNGNGTCGLGENALTCPIDGCTATSGICGGTNNVCMSGTFSDTPDTDTQYQWSCLGTPGGVDAPCSLNKPGVPLESCNANGKCDDGETFLKCPRECSPSWMQF